MTSYYEEDRDVLLVKYSEIKRTTAKAQLLKLPDGTEVWLPKAVIESHNPRAKTMYVDNDFWVSKLKEIREEARAMDKLMQECTAINEQRKLDKKE